MQYFEKIQTKEIILLKLYTTIDCSHQKNISAYLFCLYFQNLYENSAKIWMVTI